MIEKERLEELIEQGATIYELYNKDILTVQLEKDYFVINGGLYKSRYAFRTWWIKDLYETRADAEFVKEFGCIERTERLELPTWEEFVEMEEVCFFKKNHRQTVIRILGTKYITVETSYERFFTGDLTKENYIKACRTAKELFLGEKK